MGLINLEISDEEMTHLAEIATLALVMMEQNPTSSENPRARAWEKLCTDILAAASHSPTLQPQLDYDAQNDSWALSQEYAEQAFYEDVLDEYKESIFWEELVDRLCDQELVDTLGTEQAANLSEQQREQRTLSLRQALCRELSQHGLSRFGFIG